jgi:hypothetical protein
MGHSKQGMKVLSYEGLVDCQLHLHSSPLLLLLLQPWASCLLLLVSLLPHPT